MIRPTNSEILYTFRHNYCRHLSHYIVLQFLNAPTRSEPSNSLEFIVVKKLATRRKRKCLCIIFAKVMAPIEMVPSCHYVSFDKTISILPKSLVVIQRKEV